MTDYIYFRKVEFAEALKGKTIAMVTHSSREGEVDLILTFTDGTWLVVAYEPDEENNNKGTFHLEFANQPNKVHRYTKLDGPWIREDKWNGDIPGL